MNIATTSGLILEPIKLSDSKYFLEELRGIDTFLSINAPSNLVEAENLVSKYLKEIDEKKQIRFIVKNSQGDFIGCIALYNLETDDTEIQLWLTKKFQNKGYGFEIGKAFLDWIQDNIEFTVIYTAFDIKNIASQQLAKKLGGYPGMLDPRPVYQPESGKILNIIWYEFYKNKTP